MPSPIPHADIESLLRDAAARLIAPRFARLAAADVSEKSPGELVTVVDREVEALLTPALQALRPGSRVVGEEACAAQPALLQGLDDGDVWLLDPLDGTGNFIAGRPSVSLMAALLHDGETVAAWMLNPLTGSLCSAEHGAGAWRDGERVHAPTWRGGALRGVVETRFLPEPLKTQVAERCAASLAETLPGRKCAGVDYPAIAAGESDFILYWRTLPWDHAPGTLFLQEAGGRAARPDGSPYRAADPRTGLIAARSVDAWEAAQAVLAIG
jgi:fructose-1,6-bisphosphatase/inositol monophosphatase family enzyme